MPDTAKTADHDASRFSPAAIEKAIAVLKQRFGERLAIGESLRQQHSHTTTGIAEQWPDAVLFAESAAEVADAVKIAAAHHCPVIPFGVGTSLEGHVNAPFGGLSLDTSRMNQVLAINQEDMDVVVQPGVTREQLNTELRATGLFFPIDPGANASLGGMAATRASGTNAVRYGTMRDAVMALQVVLADGRVIRTGGRARKSSAGYDLTRLLVGSEGSLGIITELTLRLHGIPEAVAGGICSFPSVEAACNAVIMTIQCGVPVARIELLDALQVRACNKYSGLSLPEEPLLLLEFHGSTASVEEQSSAFADIALDFGGGGFQWTTDPEQRSILWKARHDAYWAAIALIPGSTGVATDVCVPISRLAECVEETCRDIADSGLVAPIVGHVGDGNFHCLQLMQPGDTAALDQIRAFSKRLSARAIAMGGTCTGEHGIGQGKIPYLRQEMGEAVDAMVAIKQALDPAGILNPGKVFDAPESQAERSAGL